MSRERRQRKQQQQPMSVPTMRELIGSIVESVGTKEERFADSLKLKLQASSAKAACERFSDSIKSMSTKEFEEYQQILYGDDKGKSNDGH